MNPKIELLESTRWYLHTGKRILNSRRAALRFSLRYAFASLALYGVCFAALRQYGGLGLAIALVMGTSGSGVLLLARRAQIPTLIAVAACAFVVGVLFIGFWAPHISDEFTANVVISAVGATLGGLIGSFAMRPVGGAMAGSDRTPRSER